MAKIIALKPEVYNLIAAGEVVESPVGAIKELVENCVDAGARRITVDVLGGGYDQVTITDNGCGIREDDVELAFAKYATSKLETADDLIAIQSLGFRGEALSSIAAVSRIKLTTRTNEMDTGICVSVENGRVSNKQYVAANVGTTIEVRDMYYNAPVRKKFMKDASGEKANITKFISKFILTNPNVAITYRADEKTIFESSGNGLDEAIFAVYGEGCLSNCIPVNHHHGDLWIKGYVGTPEYSKANKNYQTLSVNGRCVSDLTISSAIAQAYNPYLMTRKFPFYVLNLEIRPDAVNVNVHPKKSEVRFENLRYVSGQFYHAVQDALQDYTYIQSEQIFSPIAREFKDETTSIPKDEVAATIVRMQQDGAIELMNPGQKEDVLQIEKLTDDVDKEREFDEFAKTIGQEITVAKARIRMGLDAPTRVEQPTLTILAEEPALPIDDRNEADVLFDRARVLGIAFKTYLILDIDDKLIFIDQHAAHERILFDKFIEGAPTEMQQLMFPHTFTVRDEEALFIKANMQNILSAGFEIEEFGHNTFRITAVSSLLVDTKLNDFVELLLSSVDEFKFDDRKLIVETIAKKACKAAVKAGQTLNEYEIKYILKEVYDNKILQCPHGRPITVVFTKTQLEKMFKRIV